MAADQPDRDDEAPRTSAADPGTPSSAASGLGASGSSGSPAGPDDAAPDVPTDSGPADLDDQRAPATGDTREQPAVDDQTPDSELRPDPADLSRPDRVGPGSTSVLPPVDDVPSTPRWSARASVRTPDIAEEVHDDWAEPPRGLLVPILVTVCVLLLVALFGLGSWLLFASRPSDTPAPTPTVQNATPPATSGVQTTTTTTSPPPTQIPLPNLRGLDYEAAAAQLITLGFIPVRRDEVDGEVPKGKVVGTDPPEGTPVFTGTRINVIVSLGLPDTTPPPTTVEPSQSGGPT